MSKTERVFNAFIEGKNFNRFQAERALHDHCLPSTVSTLQQKYQITISRQFEIVRGYQGEPTSVCRYWIEPDEIERIKGRRKVPGKEKALASDQTEKSLSNNEKDVTPSKKAGQIGLVDGV